MPQDTFDPIVLDQASPMVQRVYDYWNCIRAGRRLPRRADFDPLRIPRHLPGIILINVEGVRPDGTGIYRYRVVGEWEIQARGHNPTGKLVKEGFYGPSEEAVLSDYDFVRRQGRPFYAPLDFVDAAGRRVDEYSIILPLSEDGETVSQILVYSERRRRKVGTER